MVVPQDLYASERPEDYGSLLAYLEKTGNVKFTEFAQMRRARNLYVTQGLDVATVAKRSKVDPHVLDRWVTLFGWEEERDRRVFAQFQKISGFRKRLSPHTDERHDRLAGTIESIAERLMQSHQDGETPLSVRDLSSIANLLKTTMDIRRTVRDKAGPASQRNVDVRFGPLPENMDAVASMIQGLTKEPVEKVEQTEVKQLSPPPNRVEISFGESIGTDEEFETVSEDE